jgi:LacI family transcriptional regulator
MIKMASTIKDVAKYTGLSIATISKYINGGNVLDKNRELIEDAIKALDFRVNEIARGLKTNKTMTVGVLIPDLKNIFCTNIISNIEDVLIRNGYSTIICDYKESSELEEKKMEFLVNKMVDGIILMPHNESTEQAYNNLQKDIPIVLIDRAIKDVNCDVVLVDNLNASYNAVEQLITRGHRRVGIICGPKNVYTTEERLKGYLRVHEDYALPVDNNLIKHGDYQVQSGYELLCELWNENPRPTAIFVTNYEMTLGGIIAINEKDIKIPEEVSFIGFDNLDMARIVKPPLSIVVQPMKEIGETAANILLKRLRGDMSNFPQMVRLKTEVLIKESVKKIDF